MDTQENTSARLHINLSTGEIELEGTVSFVSQYADSIGALLDRLVSSDPSQTLTSPGVAAQGTSGTATQPQVAVAEEMPFGEVLHSLSSKSGTDQILLAGHYAGMASTDGTFSTNEAHKLLIEQGVKLSNASQSMKNNLTAKRAFKVGSRFKVAKSGLDYLSTLGVPSA